MRAVGGENDGEELRPGRAETPQMQAMRASLDVRPGARSDRLPSLQEPELGPPEVEAGAEVGVNPQVIVVRSEEDLARVSVAIKRRARVSSKPVEVVLSDLDMGERARWMRRYHKLVAMLADTVQVDGVRYPPSAWDLMLKDRFLVAEEVRLPNGKVLMERQLKREMTKEQRHDFLEQVMEYAAREHGVALVNPEEEAA